MENIEECLVEFINNPYNDTINFNLAVAYEKEKQYAAAFSYYLKCAEFTNNNILASECLIHCGLCINAQGGRDAKELYLIKHAITISPNSLEPYYIASLYFSWRSSHLPEQRFWLDSYMYANIAINLIENNIQSKEKFKIPIDYEVYELYYQKAYAGMNIGKINETREIFIKILQNYELPDSTKNFIIFKLHELPEPNHPIIPYSKNNINKLKLLFNNSEKIDNNFSQIYQDMYVLSMHNGKMNGTYLEIGAGDYKYGNNTYLLESEFNWTGVSLDFNQNLVNNFNHNRNNNCICSDATTINYLELLKNNYKSTNIDYLQLDCDPPNITFDILSKIPFDQYKFGVITYEHDFYNDITGSYREKSREFLKEKGYKLIAGNISPYGDKCPFEDWWIHPEVIDENIWKLFERDNDEPINGEKYMLTKNEIINNHMISINTCVKPKTIREDLILSNTILDNFLLKNKEILNLNDLHAQWYENLSGINEYRFYSYLSTLFNNIVILDIGTGFGISAVALSHNENNHVISYNLINQIRDNSKIYTKKNITFKIKNVLEDLTEDFIKNIKIIIIDIDHFGEEERKIIDRLEQLNYSGIVILDDIHHPWEKEGKCMKELWENINYTKYDITKYGHNTGTGIFFMNFNINIIEETSPEDNDKTYEVLLQHKHHNNLVWWGGENGDKNNWNWGDQLNPWLFSKIKGVSIEKINRIPLSSEELIPRYYMIGSILNYIYSPDIEVWGSGLGFHKVPLKFFPKKIHAVRGPLTRRALINFGCDCPDVYGDPALLLPRYYTSRVKKEYKYGIIQHFSHKEDTPWVSKYRNDPTVNIIDVKNPSIIGFIDEINKCDIILSESLHGIICSDAYGIPSYHINFTPNNEYNWFKFNDYYLSVGRPLIPPYHLFDETIDIENLWPPLYNYSIKIDLDKLLDACPFKELNSSKFINYTNNNITEKIKSNTIDIDKLYDYIPCHDQKGNDIVRVNKENIQMSLVNASNDPSIIAINTEGYVKNHIEKLEQIDGWGWNVKTNESNGIYIKKSRDDTLIKCSKSSIPVLGVLVCTTTKWIEKQIQSIDFPIENYIIINNNENFLAEKLDILVSKGNKFIKNLKVYHMPYNLGCAEGWNTIIKSFLFSPYWVIVNDDVSFTPGFLNELHETALENQDAGLIHGTPCKEKFLTKFGSFDMFLIRDWVIKDFGLFDTNFYPAYQEDYDYIFRLRNSSVKIINQLNHKYYHGDTFDYSKSGQNTKKFSNKLSNKLIDIRCKNLNYFYKKWNICPEWINESSINDIYKYPFNNPANKLSMISYDIEFAREKSLHNVLPSCDIKTKSNCNR
jgi:pyruvyltransferase